MVIKLALWVLVFSVSALSLPISAVAEEVAEVSTEKKNMLKKDEFSEVRIKFENGVPIPERPDGQRYKRCEGDAEGKPKCPGMDGATITDIQTITIVNYSYNPKCQMFNTGGVSFYLCN